MLSGSASITTLRKAGSGPDLIRQYDDSLDAYQEVKLRRAEAAMAESLIAGYYADDKPASTTCPTPARASTPRLCVSKTRG